MASTAATDAATGASRGGRRLRPAPAHRVAAAATVVGSAWHAVMAVHHGGVVAGLMLAMAAACLVCAVHLWAGPARVRAWITVIAMDLAMVVAHVALPPVSGAHLHASAIGEANAASPVAMVLVSVGNLLVIGAAAYRTYRAVLLAERTAAR